MAQILDTRDVRAAFEFLNTSNISDALDRLGLSGQTVGILPLWYPCPKMAGPAMPMCLSPDAPGSTAYGQLEAVVASRPGDILVIDNEGRTDVNSWGGVVSFTAKRHGIQGVVTDGATRDIMEMKAMALPVYGRGLVQTSVRGRTGFVGYNIPARISGVVVSPGDWIFADEQGVCVVPRDRIAEVLELARQFADMEEQIRRDIVAGVDPLEAHKQRAYDQQLRSSQP